MPVVYGTSTATEPGVSGDSASSYAGVRGSNTAAGVGVRGFATGNDAIRGDSAGGAGVRGVATGANHNGVVGESNNAGNGVLGVAKNGTGVWAISEGRGHGVNALASHGSGGIIGGGIDGLAASGAGVLGVSNGVSVLGLVNQGGWHPESGLPYSYYSIGVCGAFSSTYPHADPGREAPLPWDVPYVRERTGAFPHIGVYGMANGAVVAVCPFSGGYGLIVSNTKSAFGGKAAAFQGQVEIEGDLVLSGEISTSGGDCAERFDIADACVGEPGSVLVAGAGGRLTACSAAYDKRVVGIVSGAGDKRPGLVLGKDDATHERQATIALIGRVWCKADAAFGAIEVGDLLTTAPTTGCAMKASDPSRAFGAVIGKALSPLAAGTGFVSVLVTLR